MMNAIAYAVIAALAAGLYGFFQRMAAPYINQAFGALLISVVAGAIAALVLFATRDARPLVAHSQALGWLALIGVAAFVIDYFSLLAYARGLPVSVGSPIFIGGSVVTATVVGLLLGENVGFAKIAGIALVVIGSVILTVFG
jgi:transporter family protein